MEGRPSYSAATAARSCSQCRQKRIVRDRLDRREVPVRDPFLPVELGDVVGDGAERQVHDLARIGRDVRRARVHQVPVEHDHGSRWPRRRDDAAFVRQLRSLLLYPASTAGMTWWRGHAPPPARPALWLRGMNISAPLIGITSSKNTAMFMARGSGMPSSRCQVPKSWCHCHTSPSNAALALILNWCM